MILARVLSKIYKEDGIILVDPKGQKYICGNPRSEKPITLKIFKVSIVSKFFKKRWLNLKFRFFTVF